MHFVCWICTFLVSVTSPHLRQLHRSYKLIRIHLTTCSTWLHYTLIKIAKGRRGITKWNVFEWFLWFHAIMNQSNKFVLYIKYASHEDAINQSDDRNTSAFVSKSTSWPLKSMDATSSPPPMLSPLMKTFGNVDRPVINVSACFTSVLSSMIAYRY
jgi:hypothetical protein